MRAILAAQEDPPVETSSLSLAKDILDLVMRYRRRPTDYQACADGRCPQCAAQHLNRIKLAIDRRKPIEFVLPAFPGKSPNPAKVLSARPDMAERQSLAFLDRLGQQIRNLYSPGAKILLCSDGRVFNDVVGIADGDITTYQSDLAAMQSELHAENLAFFNLDDVFHNSRFDEMRSRLMRHYGQPIESIQAEIRAGGDAQRLYCGITRFLLEDATRPNMTISRTALQKECRRRAYEVIQRSRAWDGLLAEQFPHAVRLSIHPQACGSRKIGIHLMETSDAWLTAWHSVAVEIGGRFRLMKRAHAEMLGGELIFQQGRPSHFRIHSLAKKVL